MAHMTKKQFEESFKKDILPAVVARYEQDGVPDKPARREAWNDSVDAAIKAGTLPERAGDWSKPKWLESYRPQPQANPAGSPDGQRERNRLKNRLMS